jgi:hypothetical protein
VAAATVATFIRFEESGLEVVSSESPDRLSQSLSLVSTGESSCVCDEAASVESSLYCERTFATSSGAIFLGSDCTMSLMVCAVGLMRTVRNPTTEQDESSEKQLKAVKE